MTLKTFPALPKSGFSENFLRINGLPDTFAAWVFYPGMLFRAKNIWWKGPGGRGRPHEGLDLCYYRDREGRIRSLHQGLSIPVMYEGEIVKTERDFLGESVYMRHTGLAENATEFFTIYGHVVPFSPAVSGRMLRKGDILGTIADASLRNPHIPSHLHITAAMISGPPSPERLSWSAMQNEDTVTLMDPLSILDGNFEIVPDH